MIERLCNGEATPTETKVLRDISALWIGPRALYPPKARSDLRSPTLAGRLGA
jgi:hypothetical protein